MRCGQSGSPTTMVDYGRMSVLAAHRLTGVIIGVVGYHIVPLPIVNYEGVFQSLMSMAVLPRVFRIPRVGG